MTIEARSAWRRGSSGALLPAALLVLGCAGGNPSRRGDRVDVSGYPQEIKDAYRVFALRCSRCHTLARPLNAHITDPEHWVRYVARMRRQPTSGINRDNAAVILRFLLYYTAQQRVANGEAPALPVPAPRPASGAPALSDASIPARSSPEPATEAAPSGTRAAEGSER